MELDELDLDILRILQKDGKATVEDIAQGLDRSASTVRDRIRKMEDKHVILGYTTIVDEESLGVHSDAFVSATLDREDVMSSVTKLYAIENISEILHVTGERRIMFRLKTKDNEELCNVLEKKVRPLGFKDIEVMVVLKPLIRYPGIA